MERSSFFLTIDPPERVVEEICLIFEDEFA